ncbi:MAG: hypothetical protein AB9836_06055 [Aminipila sp.]
MNDIERAIKAIKEGDCGDSECLLWDIEMEDCPEQYGCHQVCKKCHYGVTLQALQEKSERENPQPLTLEQLKERHKKPVWLDIICEDTKLWRICGKECRPGLFYFGNYGEFPMSTYGIDWVCYDHEPKESEHEND